MLMCSEKLQDAEVSVLLIGDGAMRTLNRRYRGKDRTTDVLSFPLRDGNFSRAGTLGSHSSLEQFVRLPEA